MKLIRNIKQNNTLFSQGSVVTIGNFDGVHLGHQVLLKAVVVAAKQKGIPSVAMLFEPQPAEFFSEDSAPARLSNLREKFTVIASFGVDYLYCIPFNQKWAMMSAHAFADDVLFAALQARHIFIGEDFRFGCARQGDVKFLQERALSYDCDIQITPDFEVEQHRVSSTHIRQVLVSGNLALAKTLLGRTYSLSGRVVQGHQRGRAWGIPTANLHTGSRQIALEGIYVVQVKRQSGALIQGVASLGFRPTIEGLGFCVEVHLFDFNEMIYGERLQVFFLQKLRNEEKFDSIEALIDQIHKDIAQAKQCFAVANPAYTN